MKRDNPAVGDVRHCKLFEYSILGYSKPGAPLIRVPLWGDGSCAGEVPGVGAGNQASSRPQLCRDRKPTHSQSARMSRAPGGAALKAVEGGVVRTPTHSQRARMCGPPAR